MAKFEKFSSQVPAAIRDRFSDLDHGDKQLACTGALVWYFNADEPTRRLYREWARAIAEGCGTIEEPPDTVRAVLAKRNQQTRQPKASRKR